MQTTEIIEGKKVLITWEFIQVEEYLDGKQWAVWLVKGTDEKDYQYFGTCQASGTDPDDSYDDKIEIDTVIEPRFSVMQPFDVSGLEN